MRVTAKMRAEAEPLYREGGEAVGRLLSYHPDQEPRIWSLVAGAGIWKRWHLAAFKSIWRTENPVEYGNLKSARSRARSTKKAKADEVKRNRKAAKDAITKDKDS